MMKRSLLCAAAVVIATSCASEYEGGVGGSIDLSDDTHLNFVLAPFDGSRAEVSRVGRYVAAIHGRPYWGTDGTLPDSMLLEADVQFPDARVSLDVSGMYEARPIAQNVTMRFDPSTHLYVVTGLFSDGAGAFVASWVLTKEHSQRTLITNDDLVMCIVRTSSEDECW